MLEARAFSQGQVVPRTPVIEGCIEGCNLTDTANQVRRLYRVASWSEPAKPKSFAMQPLAQAAE